ncbi:MAG: hypothetical protein IPI79_09870 [Moraxellaceae bacterium]|nr:hypothetical protein [Moraxellaceae bacterium]
MGAWWEHYQAVSLDEQELLLKSLDRQKAKKAAKAKATTKQPPKPKT